MISLSFSNVVSLDSIIEDLLYARTGLSAEADTTWFSVSAATTSHAASLGIPWNEAGLDDRNVLPKGFERVVSVFKDTFGERYEANVPLVRLPLRFGYGSSHP